ncbi:MAG: EAL domain-containing protein [Gammaproteobacteria bacterium]|nr:EAL domain-containing protein [Gammaproteobacteria bacterium]
MSVLSIVIVFTNYTATQIDSAIEEAEHDLKFFSGIIKNYYLANDYAAIEQVMKDWTNNNTLDYKVVLTAANGFELYSYTSNHPVDDTTTVSKSIYQDGRLLFTLTLERDVARVIANINQTKNMFILIGLGFGVFFAVLSWAFLHKFAFRPLENEIRRRHKAESELKKINDELEGRVVDRTAAIQKLSSVVEQTDDIVIITDKNGIVDYVNPSFERYTGYSYAEILNKNISMIKSGLHDREFYKKLWSTITSGDSYRDIFINRKKNDEIFYEEKTITPVKGENGEIEFYVATGKDISDRIEAQEKLHHMATHDTLTGLPNKLMIIDRLAHAIEQASRSKTSIAVLFLDLDHFKHINDNLGHHIGDRYLKLVSDNLVKCVRKGDTVGRFGGDEFIILMEGINGLDDVTTVCRKILEVAASSYSIESYDITNSTSIGVSMYPQDANDANALLKNADIAMYKAKSRGGNIYQLYTQELSTISLERMQMQHKLRHSINNEEFWLSYQPFIDLESGKVKGMEALLRWHQADGKNIGPEQFVPVLEEMGLIIDVGEWVIQKACEFNAKLVAKGHSSLKVSVNLSARQISDDKLLPTIVYSLEKYGLLPENLEIEITETMLLESTEKVTKVLQSLHDLGISISIDDFGTGFSSLAYLKKYPVDALKIDRSFVKDIPKEGEDVAIVNAIIALGKNLDLKLIAEGVETEQQKAFFEASDCDQIQGFLISKSLSEEDFEKFLEEELEPA